MNNHTIKNNQVWLWSRCTTKSYEYIWWRNGVLGSANRRHWPTASRAMGSGLHCSAAVLLLGCWRRRYVLPPTERCSKPPESTGLLEPSKSCPMVPSLHQNQLSVSVASCSHIICSWLLLLQPIDCCVNKHINGTKLQCWSTLQSKGSFKHLVFASTFCSLPHYSRRARTCRGIGCRLSISQLRSCLQDSFPAGLTSSGAPFHPVDFRSTRACQTEYTLIALDRNFWSRYIIGADNLLSDISNKKTNKKNNGMDSSLKILQK